ncbi:MAG: DUF72 domain-containing protein [Spirochaetes bacterium]|nr:DUF72 domain-containing protein [Spirochaetota bacterium]
MAVIRVGCSGYYYGHWKVRFYPEGSKNTELFDLYKECFDTVEINAAFYHNPTGRQVESWIGKSGSEFAFSFKAPRSITHYKRFFECRDDIALFLHLIKPVREARKLGCILFQSPLSLQYSVKLIERFTYELPEGYRYAFEFRNWEYCCERIYGLLAERGMDFAWISDQDRSPFERVIAKFKYTAARRRIEIRLAIFPGGAFRAGVKDREHGRRRILLLQQRLQRLRPPRCIEFAPDIT